VQKEREERRRAEDTREQRKRDELSGSAFQRPYTFSADQAGSSYHAGAMGSGIPGGVNTMGSTRSDKYVGFGNTPAPDLDDRTSGSTVSMAMNAFESAKDALASVTPNLRFGSSSSFRSDF